MTDIYLIFYKNGERSAGTISEDDYYNVFFPLFIKKLKPLNEDGIKLIRKSTVENLE